MKEKEKQVSAVLDVQEIEGNRLQEGNGAGADGGGGLLRLHRVVVFLLWLRD